MLSLNVRITGRHRAVELHVPTCLESRQGGTYRFCLGKYRLAGHSMEDCGRCGHGETHSGLSAAHRKVMPKPARAIRIVYGLDVCGGPRHIPDPVTPSRLPRYRRRLDGESSSDRQEIDVMNVALFLDRLFPFLDAKMLQRLYENRHREGRTSLAQVFNQLQGSIPRR